MTLLRIGVSAKKCCSGVGDEGPHLGRVFAAGSGFNAGDDVDAPGAQRGDGFGYIFRVQAAGGDQVEFASNIEERLARG